VVKAHAWAKQGKHVIDLQNRQNKAQLSWLKDFYEFFFRGGLPVSVPLWQKSGILIQRGFSRQLLSTLPKPFQPYPTLLQKIKDCLFLDPS
jgi:hypothetical protein